ncbi:sensor histidine kinase [Xylanimonas protaetiae]|uniref:histidine kinase n=1 Tax=Xylanimonas protaetiae TaxID=2509457 RepID=A0A4P6FL83_9MICO|nr:histidine kinase [Xylanimonas protaetiae]QAY71398.1 sensor histidine kinase [Xylanimonas protaetiae]
MTWAVAVAGLLLLPTLARLDTGSQTVLPGTGSLRWWAVVAAVTAQSVAVAWARRRPVAALLGVSAALALLAVTHPSDAAGTANLAVPVVAFRAVASHPMAHLRAALTGATTVVAAGSAIELARAQGGFSLTVAGAAAGTALVLVVVGLIPGLVVASRRAVAAARDGELRALAREQAAVLRGVVAAERTAMAREVHDIAAHHLSGMALMLSAIDRQVDTDPAAAREGVRAVREQSRVVLNDLRRLVGLLREGGAAEALGPLTLAAVPGLVDATAARHEASVVVLPAADDASLGASVGPVAQAAGYRMVQESLANARQHAPGARCVVTVDDTHPDGVALTVRNDPPAYRPTSSPSGGHGLLGMRERAELVGATLRHGPNVDGGWEVRLWLPRDARRTEDPGGHA